MPRLSPARSAARRKQILDAALQCFAAVGFQTATMSDIAEAANQSPANLYRHFSSKQALVEAIADARHRQERRLIQEAFEGACAPAALHRLCDLYVDWLRDPAERLRRRVGVGIWEHGLRDAKARGVMARGMAQHRHLVRRLEAAKRKGELPSDFDAAGVSRLLLAIFQGTILQQAYEPRLNLDRIAAQVHRLIDALVAFPPRYVQARLH